MAREHSGEVVDAEPHIQKALRECQRKGFPNPFKKVTKAVPIVH